MADAKTMKEISDACLNGRMCPKGLELLWLTESKDDTFLKKAIGWKLLTSLEALEVGYGEQIAGGDRDIMANICAHQQVFRRVGFFAESDNGEFLGFDFESGPAGDPPVIRLDSEGQYDWKGKNLVEAMLREGEAFNVEDEVRSWIASQGMPIEDFGEFGSSTQFLFSMKEWHKRRYFEMLGQPRSRLPSGKTPALWNEPATWILRPGEEVRGALLQLLDLPGSTVPKKQWVACDDDGRVCTVWFHEVSATKGILVNGVGFRMSHSEVRRILGNPSRVGVDWLTFPILTDRLWLRITDGESK